MSLAPISPQPFLPWSYMLMSFFLLLNFLLAIIVEVRRVFFFFVSRAARA